MKTSFLIISVIGIVIASTIGSLLFFVPIYQENLQICANTHDEMSSLIPEKDMEKIKELGNKYSSYRCSEKTDQWKDLAHYPVYRVT